MKVTDIDLRKMLEFQPDKGQLLLGRDRMLLFRQDAFAMLRKLLREQVGEALMQAILSQFGYRCGDGDHKVLAANYQWDSEIDEMSAGPVMHTWEGIVHVEPTSLNFDRKAGRFHMTGIWRNSYEAEIHLKELGSSKDPVCHTLTGYASGWCSAFFGAPVVAIETKCIGRGDEHCAFEIRTPEAWGPEALPWKNALSATNYSIARELEGKLSVIERQQQAIFQLSTPIIQLWDGVLAVPIVSAVDSTRAALMTEKLFAAIVRTRSRFAIIDVTGVETIDTATADHFIRLVRGVRLLGARGVVSGISPSIAQTIMDLGVDLAGVSSYANLQDALKACMQAMSAQAAESSG